MRPKIITICGSSKFVDIMAVCAWLLEKNENAIVLSLHLLPIWYDYYKTKDHLAEAEGVSDKMDKLHLRKIDISDEIFVVNRDYYIGDSTKREIEYAKGRGIPVRWYLQDDIGREVENLIERFLRQEVK